MLSRGTKVQDEKNRRREEEKIFKIKLHLTLKIIVVNFICLFVCKLNETLVTHRQKETCRGGGSLWWVTVQEKSFNLHITVLHQRNTTIPQKNRVMRRKKKQCI